LHDQRVELTYPPSVAADIEFIYRDSVVNTGSPGAHVVIDETADGLFSVAADGTAPVAGLARVDLPTFVMEAVVHGLVNDLTTAVALHAGAVAHNGKAALIAGPTGAGKSSLVAWLIGNGFDYLSDEIALLLAADTTTLGLPRAIVLKPGSAEEVLALPSYQCAKVVPAGEHVMVRPKLVEPVEARPHPCRLIVFPHYEAGSGLRVVSMSPAQTALRLVGTNLNARNLVDGGFRALTGFARQVPAVTLHYGGFEQLPGTVDVLGRFLLDGGLTAAAGRRFLSLFTPGAPRSDAIATTVPPAPKKYEIPAPTPRRQPRKLTIGMATYDDYDGVYFSLQALRLYHPEIIEDCNFLVIDNRPDGPCAEGLKALEGSTPHYRYVPFNSYSGTAASKNLVFSEANGEFVLCLDCHVFVVPGALRRLLDYFEAHPATMDLLQGPLIHDDLANIATHFRPAWSSGMYGCWDMDERGRDPDAPPFDIPMQGMGLFACRRSAWPEFNACFRGFGGEEGYIHEKFRQNRGRTLCLPFLRWMHRFRRPMGVPYTNRWEDRVRNYLIGFRELGLPTVELENHYGELLGEAAGAIFKQVRQELGGT
jgi:Glycosyl transferase family 2